VYARHEKGVDDARDVGEPTDPGPLSLNCYSFGRLDIHGPFARIAL
jgi:hypothetical protein